MPQLPYSDDDQKFFPFTILHQIQGLMLREGGGKMELVKSRFTVDNYSLQPIKKQKDLTEHLTMVKKKKRPPSQT